MYRSRKTDKRRNMSTWRKRKENGWLLCVVCTRGILWAVRATLVRDREAIMLEARWSSNYKYAITLSSIHQFAYTYCTVRVTFKTLQKTNSKWNSSSWYVSTIKFKDYWQKNIGIGDFRYTYFVRKLKCQRQLKMRNWSEILFDFQSVTIYIGFEFHFQS